VGVWVNVQVLSSLSYPKEPVEPILLAFPVRTGLYVIANGGSPNGVGMNNAARDWLGRPTNNPPALTYSVDIMEMTARGMLSSDGVLANNRNSYEGWDEPVYAPCPGQVVAFETGNPDQQPTDALEGFALGNYVVVQCFDYYVTISNLRNGFDPIRVGENLWFDRIIGYMGTSGTPSLPHVHIHVTVGGYGLDATPVPIEFEERFRVRNDIFVR
jgi:hypothetical protein